MARYPPSSVEEYVPLAALDTPHDHEEPQDKPLLTPEKTTITAWRRLGTLNVLVLLLGSALLLIPVVFLGLLWKESIEAISGNKPNKLWVQIIHADWASRSVTICTAMIRTVIALQAGIATSMVGGVILEKIGALLSHAPLYSVIRAVSVSPSTLLLSTGVRPKNLISLLIAILVITEVLVTVASQLFSTILISDFKNSEYTDTRNSTNVPIWNNDVMDVWGPPWWKMPSVSSRTFAEFSEPFSESSYYHDTGHTYRAFLPVNDESLRTTLRQFHGPAPVIDHRVVCIKPSVMNLALHQNRFGSSSMRLSGQMMMGDESYPMLRNTETQASFDFNCAFSIPFSWATTYGYFGICSPWFGTQWKVQLEDPLVKATFNDTTVEQLINANDPRASALYMVVEILDAQAVWSVAMSRVQNTTNVTAVRGDGPWTIVNNGSDIEALRISACFTNLVSNTFTVQMNSSWQGLEPKLSWDRVTQRYNTESIRHQLGATMLPGSLRDRGVLQLESRSQWEDYNLTYGDVFDEYGTHWWFDTNFLRSSPDDADVGIVLDEGSNQAFTETTDRSHADVFQATLRDTNSPALALQALLTRATQVAYYEILVKLGSAEPASTWFSVIALVPTRWTGFIATVSTIAAHFIILVIITLFFLVYTENSFLGNYWQAVSQVVSEDTLPILDQAYALKDEEIKRWKYQLPQLGKQSFLRLRENRRIAIGTGRGA